MRAVEAPAFRCGVRHVKYLLDTHILLWLEGDSTKLSPSARAIIDDDTNGLLVSFASLWELQIKARSGKLKLSSFLLENLVLQRELSELQLLPISGEHILTFGTIPQFHKDPFDLMVIAQLLYEGLPIISADAIFTSYPITVIW